MAKSPVDHISFGTDGWRGVMADDFTFDGVRLVAEAIAGYIIDQGMGDKPVIIGHDARFLGSELAELCRERMSDVGLNTLTFARPMPTPLVAWAIRYTDAAGAVMLTASHNPPQYNGIKFIPFYAGPASSEITRGVEERLGSKVHAATAKGKSTTIDVLESYTEHLKKIVDTRVIASSPPSVVADPMHGAGCGILEDVLAALGADVSSLRDDFDPTFGGHEPDPSEKNLAALREAVLGSGSSLGLAIDGDGDRFGVIDRSGAWMSPNEVISCLAEYLLGSKGAAGSVVRTVATTHYLDDIAARYGARLVETAVGFKWIAAEMLDGPVVIGGEESGGLSVLGHVPEKDGLLAAGLVLEACARLDLSPAGQLRAIAQRYGRRISRRLDMRVTQEMKQTLMTELGEKDTSEIAGQKVADIITIDGVKFVLESGDWLLVRPSGTEPVVRVYLEAGTEERLGELSAFAYSVMS